MAAFVDTSAFHALLAANDPAHEQARGAFDRFAATQATLMTHNYVLVETVALVQARIGTEAVRALRDSLLPAVDIGWVDPPLHDLALREVIASGRRQVSFVDRVSFAFMRNRGIQTAFALDAHFRDEGFQLLP